MKAICYIVMNLTDIFYIVYTNVSLTWFENVPLPLLKMYIIKKNKVLSYLCLFTNIHEDQTDYLQRDMLE
jgi:hypothetical protein